MYSYDELTLSMLQKYKEPASSETVVTQDSMRELNEHNYVHKMHRMLDLEEITRHRLISRYKVFLSPHSLLSRYAARLAMFKFRRAGPEMCTKSFPIKSFSLCVPVFEITCMVRKYVKPETPPHYLILHYFWD